VVSVLATGPKGCRFEPGQGDKNQQRTFLSDGKRSRKVPCRKILRLNLYDTAFKALGRAYGFNGPLIEIKVQSVTSKVVFNAFFTLLT
jgi:hypothetical protein